MKLSNLLPAAVVALACCLLVSCKSGNGPLLINLSGQPARLVIQTDRGETFDGSCEDQAAVWVGRSGTQVSRIEIQMSAATHVLEGEELRTPFGKDHTTAFLIEATGPRKLTLDEAGILMRNRPD